MSKKWRREIKANLDKNQPKLAPNNLSGVTTIKQPIIIQTHSTDDQVMCPFCLYINKLNTFLISTKKGISTSKAKCPDCGNEMMMRSLTKEMTPEEFAEWCYLYAASGYWQKVPFKKYVDRMYKLGWSYRFWKRYKQLKGEDTTEIYQDYVMRKQQEEYEAEQRGEG